MYIGGGFPEEFAAQLTAQKKVIADFREKISQGMPTFAECGGYMFLTEEIIDHNGNSYEMVGIIPAKVQMQQRLAALGYREITALTQQVLLNKGETAKGHEFHYSRLIPTIENYPYAYKVKGLGGEFLDGYHQENLVAGYTHFYFPSNPNVVIHWLEKAVEYQKKINSLEERREIDERNEKRLNDHLYGKRKRKNDSCNWTSRSCIRSRSKGRHLSIYQIT